MKGQWCDYNKNRFCQESAGCSGCEIYLRRDSNSQETNKHAVLQSVISPNLPFSSDALQTRAGVNTYSIPPLKTPACTPISYQGVEIDLSVVDGKHNRTGRRQARGSVIPINRESELHVGSNPTHPIRPIAQWLEHHNQIRGIIVADDGSIPSQGIPAGLNLLLFLSDMGAGQYFSNTIELPDPAPTIIMGGKI